MADDDSVRFWAFSCAVYADPAVAAAALRLQDAEGRDVNLALYCLFAGFELGRDLAPAELDRLARAVEPWNAAVLRPLRAIRRWLPGDADGFRSAVKALELEAERRAQASLAAAAPAGPAADPGGAAAARNLARYAGPAGQALFEAVASRLAAGLAPAPDGADVEAV